MCRTSAGLRTSVATTDEVKRFMRTVEVFRCSAGVECIYIFRRIRLGHVVVRPLPLEGVRRVFIREQENISGQCHACEVLDSPRFRMCSTTYVSGCAARFTSKELGAGT